jgi:hypothetical protein
MKTAGINTTFAALALLFTTSGQANFGKSTPLPQKDAPSVPEQTKEIDCFKPDRQSVSFDTESSKPPMRGTVAIVCEADEVSALPENERDSIYDRVVEVWYAVSKHVPYKDPGLSMVLDEQKSSAQLKYYVGEEEKKPNGCYDYKFTGELSGVEFITGKMTFCPTKSQALQ